MPDEPLTGDLLAGLLVRGPRPVRVALSGYDPIWVARFDARVAELRLILGDRARLIEHIGSTAVPGLAAKPIADIVVGIADPDDEAAYLAELEAAGYELRVREAGHRCLRIGEPDELINLHCYPPDHAEIRKYLVFRDRLRGDDDDRRLYEAAKRSLADREWPDMNYYAEAKRPVIDAILGRAGWKGRSAAEEQALSPQAAGTDVQPAGELIDRARRSRVSPVGPDGLLAGVTRTVLGDRVGHRDDRASGL